MEHLLSEKLVNLIQFRINQEEQSSRIYRAMSEWLTYHGYTGAGSLWKKYSEEELKHAEWAYSFLSDLDILPKLGTIVEPECEFKGLPEIIDKSFAHEVLITQQCNELYEEALKEYCGTVSQLALKYQTEQVDELGKMTKWLDRLEAFGEDKVALRFLDNEMGES